MASDYNKTVTSRNSVNPANFSFNTGNIIGYPSKISSGSRSNSGGSTTNITLNLDELLTDNLEEGVTSEKIADPKQYNTDDKKGFFESLGDMLTSVGATLAVGTTSVLSGVLDIVEDLGDGVVWVASKAVGIFNPDAADAMEEFIARDLVTEANEWLYEDTEFGRAINDASYMKYDSDTAQGIRSVTTTVTEIAAATALTVATGGAAAPLVVGTAVGLGKAAESTYQTHGTDTTLMQELGIGLSGVLNGLSWMANGKLGQGALNILKDSAAKGFTNVMSGVLKEMTSWDFWKNALKEGLSLKNSKGKVNFNALMNYLTSAFGTAGTLTPYITGEEEFDATAAYKILKTYVTYLGLNILEDTVMDYVSDYKVDDILPLVDGNTGVIPDTPKSPDVDDAKPIETLDETGLEDAAPKQPSADTPAPKPYETLDEPEILPEAKTPHPDDEYLDKALDILNPNTATKLSDEIGKLDDEGLQKVLSAMTGAEIAAQLKDLDAKGMDRVLYALSGDQLTDVVGEIAERISKGELPSDILDKLDPVVRLEVLDRTDPFSLSDDYMRRRIMELESQAKKVTDESQLDLIDSELDSLNQALVRKIHDLDNPSYEKYIQDVINKKIENAQWGGKTLDADELALVTKEAEEIAANTIANIERLKSDGIFKDGYTTEDIVKLIQSDVDPKTYLSAKGIEEWKADFGIQGKGPNDTVTVYVFQDTSNPYCVANEAGKNYNGALGRSGENGGAFVLSDTKIDELVKEGIINPDGTVTDIDALNKELGANYTGPMVLIGVDTKVSDLQLPRGNNEGAYLGEWCPGGMTSGGTYEAVIPATDDYVIISDSRTITGG